MDDDTLLFSYTKGENREFSVDVIVQNHDIINFINEVYPEDCPIQVCEEFLEEAEYMTLMRLTKSDAV